LGPNKALYLGNRSSGKQIGNQRPVVLRFKIIRLRKEGFVQIEGPVIFIIFVPFVLRIVYLVVHRRSCKVELRGTSTVSLDSESPNETRQSPHSERSVQCHLVNVNIVTRRAPRGAYRISDGAPRAGLIDSLPYRPPCMQATTLYMPHHEDREIAKGDESRRYR
jgi:hypothetical protein